MEAGTSSAKRIGVGDVINETFSIYGGNFAALFGAALIVFVVVGLIAGLLQTGGVILGLIGAIVRIAGNALYTGFVVKLVDDVRDGRRDQTVGGLFEAAAPVILPLIGFGILFAIGVGIGFVLLIVPGLILLTFWSVGAPAIVVEGVSPVDAFGRSWRLVRGNGWAVFGALLVTLLIVLAIGIVLAAIGAAIGVGGLIVAAIISSAITAPIFSIAVTVIYFDLAGSGQAAEASPFEPPPASPTV